MTLDAGAKRIDATGRALQRGWAVNAHVGGAAAASFCRAPGPHVAAGVGLALVAARLRIVLRHRPEQRGWLYYPRGKLFPGVPQGGLRSAHLWRSCAAHGAWWRRSCCASVQRSLSRQASRSCRSTATARPCQHMKPCLSQDNWRGGATGSQDNPARRAGRGGPRAPQGGGGGRGGHCSVREAPADLIALVLCILFLVALNRPLSCAAATTHGAHCIWGT